MEHEVYLEKLIIPDKVKSRMIVSNKLSGHHNCLGGKVFVYSWTEYTERVNTHG